MIQKIKALDFKDFLDVFEEISKDLTKDLTKEKSQPTVMDNISYNLSEDDNLAYLEIPLPGFDKSEITSVLNGSTLTVKAVKKSEEEYYYIVKNFNIGDLEFTIPLRIDIAGGVWKATLDKGILTYIIEKSKPKDNSMYINII